jgi:hypothetical protein
MGDKKFWLSLMSEYHIEKLVKKQTNTAVTHYFFKIDAPYYSTNFGAEKSKPAVNFDEYETRLIHPAAMRIL